MPLKNVQTTLGKISKNQANCCFRICLPQIDVLDSIGLSIDLIAQKPELDCRTAVSAESMHWKIPGATGTNPELGTLRCVLDFQRVSSFVRKSDSSNFLSIMICRLWKAVWKFRRWTHPEAMLAITWITYRRGGAAVQIEFVKSELDVSRSTLIIEFASAQLTVSSLEESCLVQRNWTAAMKQKKIINIKQRSEDFQVQNF